MRLGQKLKSFALDFQSISNSDALSFLSI
jgi:hypothetical protein